MNDRSIILYRWSCNNSSKETYRMDIGAQEDFGVNLFIPAHAKPLNGEFALDGTINLNSGREEL